MARYGQTRHLISEGLREDTPVQAPQRGGPFILTDQSQPQLLETLNSRTHMAKFIANCFIGVGAAIITYRAIQAALQLRRKRKERCVPRLSKNLLQAALRSRSKCAVKSQWGLLLQEAGPGDLSEEAPGRAAAAHERAEPQARAAGQRRTGDGRGWSA